VEEEPVEEETAGHVPDLMNKLTSLCKQRGFVFQSSEIYGGVGSVYDYGPLGVELKQNLRQRWWRDMVQRREDVEGLDSGILMNPRVWEASGHVEGFTDPLVECQNCHRRFRADHLLEGEEEDRAMEGAAALGEDAEERLAETRCPVCGVTGEFTEPRQFNLMFRTFMGPVQDEGSTTYLRPETAQGIYVNFRNVRDTSRQKVPFGIAQVGKAFRNEITPGNFIFRTREFEQMEMQYFVKPGADEEWFERWRDERLEWVEGLGVDPDRLRLREHGPDELAHYAKKAVDIQYRFPFGWQEFEGIHNRTDFDLSRHQEHSGKRLEYIDPAADERFVPYVVETSAGLDRTLLVVLADAYAEEEIDGSERTLLRLDPGLAPIKAAVFPLVKKDGMPEMAHRITDDLREHLPVFYDESGSIGRRYRRQDEAGTPFCITVDGQSTDDGTVTVRDRDSAEQDRVAADRLREYLTERIPG
jgi:glycyl-tRNA synthetase